MSEKLSFESLGQKAKRKKDFLIVIAIGAIITFIIVSVGMAIFDSDPKKAYQARKEIEDKKDFKVIGEKDYKENWALTVENKLQKQDEQLQNFMESVIDENNKSKSELKDLLLQMSEAQEKSLSSFKSSTKSSLRGLEDKFDKRFSRLNNRIEEVSLQKASSVDTKGSNQPDISLGDDFLPPVPGSKQRNDNGNNQQNNSADSFLSGLTGPVKNKISQQNSQDNSLDQKPVSTKPKMSIVTLDTSANKSEIKKRQDEIALLASEKDAESNSFHLMTGLSQAYMLTGAYAPVFSSGDTEPLPVLLQAQGNILIANNDRLSIDKCMLIGSAKGNMNSQTADIRLVSISCSLDGKKLIEGSISGWVIGENGIPGVQGELLHKNGAWLAKTFVAGFLQTFANALSRTTSTAPTITIGNTGTTTAATSSDPISGNMENAAYGGTSKVFSQLGKYYMKMAEQIFPVIEVKGGRTVDILLKGGEDFSVRDFGRMDIADLSNRAASLKGAKVKSKSGNQTVEQPAQQQVGPKPSVNDLKAKASSIFSNSQFGN